jgi:hypothetical protein
LILIVLVSLNLLACLGNLIPERKEDYRAAARLVAEQSLPGDVILFAPGFIELPFDYYYLDRKEAFGFSRDSLQDGVITEQVASVYPAPLAALEGRPRAGRDDNQHLPARYARHRGGGGCRWRAARHLPVSGIKSGPVRSGYLIVSHIELLVDYFYWYGVDPSKPASLSRSAGLIISDVIKRSAPSHISQIPMSSVGQRTTACEFSNI